MSVPDLACAVCHRLDHLPRGAVFTIANGHALCRQHFERLSDWETTTTGPVSLLTLIRYMTQPAEIPSRHWLTARSRTPES